jgi:amino acid transporter
MQRQSTETNEKNLSSERDVESLSKHERHLPVDDVENLEIYAEYEGDNAKEGNLHRGIQSRQIGMIAVSLQYLFYFVVLIIIFQLGGAVGTGLVIGSGTALTRGGPLGLFLGYAFIG